jgi:hypothetical protein
MLQGCSRLCYKGAAAYAPGAAGYASSAAGYTPSAAGYAQEELKLKQVLQFCFGLGLYNKQQPRVI